MITLTFDKLFTYTTKENTNAKKRIGSSAFSELSDWLFLVNQSTIAHFLDNLFTWAGESEWRYWETSKGKWTKRFASSYWKNYDEKIPDDLLAQIGERISRHIEVTNEVYYTFSKQEWSHGSFELNTYSPDGKLPGPCWWGEHNASRLGLLKSEEGFAVKFFKEPKFYSANNNKGIGRCWGYKVNDDSMVIFNAYGPLRLEHIAAMLAEQFKLPYKRIKLQSAQDEHGRNLLYINMGEYNNDGRQGGKVGIGYVIGKDADNIDTFVLPDVRIRDAICPSCKKECFSSSLTRLRMHDGIDKSFCNECVKSIFICHKCRLAYYTDDIHTIGEHKFCKKCYDEFPTCSTHGKTLNRVSKIWHTSRTYCTACELEDIVRRCRGCYNMKDAANVIEIELPAASINLCLSCKSKVGKHA